MQRVAVLTAVVVAVGVLRLGEGSPVPTVAAISNSARPAKRQPPAAAPAAVLGQSLPDSRQPSAQQVGSRSLQKREASPSMSLVMQLPARGTAHSQQKREASPVSLSINSPMRVLRQRIRLQMYRRMQQKIKENNEILRRLGKRKRSVSWQPESRPGDRYAENRSQWLLS